MVAALLLLGLGACSADGGPDGDPSGEAPDKGGMGDGFPDGGPVVSAIAVALQPGSRQVRQGAGTVFLDISGEGLDAIEAGALGLDEVVLVEQSETSLRVALSLPHGAPVGARELVLSTSRESVTFPDVLTVTAITVSPEGSDAEGAGTPDRPFRSLTRALAAVGQGDGIFLHDGVYSVDGGENFVRYDGWLPEGVRIVGESRDGTIIDGGKGRAFPGAGFLGHGGLVSLTVMRATDAGVTAKTGRVSLEDVRIADSSVGIHAYGAAAVTVRSSHLVGHVQAAVKAEGNAQVVIDATQLEHATGDGVIVDGSGGGAPFVEIDGKIQD